MNNTYYICDWGNLWKVDKNFICYYYSSMGRWVGCMDSDFYSEIFMDAVSKNQMTRITKESFEKSMMLKELSK